jgi:hypothetical protein
MTAPGGTFGTGSVGAPDAAGALLADGELDAVDEADRDPDDDRAPLPRRTSVDVSVLAESDDPPLHPTLDTSSAPIPKATRMGRNCMAELSS